MAVLNTKNPQVKIDCSAGRQFNAKRRPLALGTLHADRAAHQVDVALDDGQADAGMKPVGLTRWVGAVEALEYVFPRLGGDADAGVLYLQENVAVLPFQGQLDAALRAV